MAVVLRNPSGEFLINNHGWSLLIPLAVRYGWKPKGVASPEHWSHLSDERRPDPWPPANYFHGGGQRMSPQDASAIADALHSALDDLPDHDPLAEKADAKIEVPGFPRLRVATSSVPTNAMEVFGGPNKPDLVRLIAFLRHGPVAIW